MALTCTILALVCLIGSGAYSLYLSYLSRQSGSTISLYLSIYDFALFAIAYMLILIGNLQGTTLAYQGMLMYVFITLLFGGAGFLREWLLEFRYLLERESLGDHLVPFGLGF
jgi:hypothetical protein